MKIKMVENKANVYTPYNKDFVAQIKRIGGAKSGKTISEIVDELAKSL